MSRSVLILVAVVAAGLAEEHPNKSPADEQTWKKVVYLGGVPGVRVDRLDLKQTLTLTPSELIVKVEPTPQPGSSIAPKKEPRVLFAIPRESALAVTYEGFRHDKPGAQRWIGIPGHWPKSTDHLIIIDYHLTDGRDAEVLLRVDKSDYREIVDALRQILPESEVNTATP